MELNLESICAQVEQARAALNSDQSLFVPNYWKAPDLSPHGSATQAEVFQAVGAALSAWESVESALAMLYVILCDGETGPYKALARTFGSITSSGSRREAIKAAAEIYFGQDWETPKVKKRLVRILESIGEASRRRDEIAHGQAHGATINNKSYGHFLFASEYISSRNYAFPQVNSADPLSFFTAKYRYTAVDILEFEIKFNALREAVWQYLISIKKISGTPAEVIIAMQT
ncbi:hypothetical protein AO286_26575 [Pseudomonas syringae]|uniref:hypothetical protein n=1 Tax=Pseudomonas syringae group TaxID=136849 RepID=UPI000C080C57|nr:MULTISPECIES: hypothetical protein [Pseudomonas syringae group]PHN53232.1 hypothetical protein AO286_26575 [Pseudomonas syringae]RMR21760.1 hypothetical protein ALP89_200000 [Pseudomonas syringae pv. persicae]